MRRARLVLAAALVAACSSAPDVPPRVGFSGYHGVRVGMTPEQASAAYGEPLAPPSAPTPDANACYYLFPGGRRGPVAFMVSENAVVRVEVTEPGIFAEAGVGVGSLESEVQGAYENEASVSPHKYTPEGHVLTVSDTEGFELVFETDGTRVTQYRAGRLPEVEWVEGCL